MAVKCGGGRSVLVAGGGGGENTGVTHTVCAWDTFPVPDLVVLGGGGGGSCIAHQPCTSS